MKDLNLRPETIELIKENITGKLLGSDFFFYLTPKIKATKAEINGTILN